MHFIQCFGRDAKNANGKAFPPIFRDAPHEQKHSHTHMYIRIYVRIHVRTCYKGKSGEARVCLASLVATIRDPFLLGNIFL